MNSPRLLAIVELGGYPNFVPLYRRLGFEVDVVPSQRKARAHLKGAMPDVIVAEYNFQTDFRDRSSNLETLMAILQKNTTVNLIVVYPLQHAQRLAAFRDRWAVFAALPLPVSEAEMEAALRQALGQ